MNHKMLRPFIVKMSVLGYFLYKIKYYQRFCKALNNEIII